MLVVTRKVDQAVKIGDDITVFVVAISGNDVRLGIEAPRHLRVSRDDEPRRPGRRPEA